MPYLLKNIHTGDVFVCDDKVWAEALEAAKKEGWEPMGTKLLLEHEMDKWVDDDMQGRMGQLHMVLFSHHNTLEWDGSYLAKEGQLVKENDAWELSGCMAVTGADQELIRFVEGGSFEIWEAPE